jgi:two-component system, sensor histidine kinase RegB
MNKIFIEPEREKFRWLLWLRYHMLFGIIAMAVVGINQGFIARPSIHLYVYACFLAVIVTSTSHVLWKRRIKITPRFVGCQLGIDLLIFTGLLASSGGTENPFLAFFYVHAFLGGMLLAFSTSLFFLALTIGCLAYIQYLSLNHLEVGTQLSWLNSSSQYLILIVSWSLARTVGKHLSLGHQQILNLKTSHEKMDRLRSIGALTAGFSHEFASPLNTIKLRLERLQSRIEDAKSKDDIIEAMIAVEQCSSVIRKMNSSQVDPRDFEYSDFNLQSHMKHLTDIWKGERDVDFILNLESKLRLPIVNFSQTIINLYDNAWDSTSKKLQLSVQEQITDEEVIITISDNGSGVPEEVIRRVGEPFNTTKSIGNGLGLYCSVLFMNSVGGNLNIENTGTGASVHLRFPITCRVS